MNPDGGKSPPEDFPSPPLSPVPIPSSLTDDGIIEPIYISIFFD